MNEEGGGRIMKMKKILFVALSLMLLLAFGCSKDTNNSSVTNPNPDTLYPKGHVQGIVKDACTLEPIEGAVVDIGFASAKTNARGQYIIKNVPATTYVKSTEVDGELEIDPSGRGNDIDVDGELEIDSGYRGNYSAAISMANAKINGVPVTNYAKTYYNEVYVRFASMEPSTGFLSADNADITPVTGLVSGDFDFLIGQLSAGIGGHVVKADLITPVSGYTVYLFSNDNGRTGNSATGRYGNKVAQTTTDATGKFLFTGLEANQLFDIFVVDTPTAAPALQGFTTMATNCNGSVIYTADVIVTSTDELCPFIVTTSPIMYTDVSSTTGTAGLDVVITFSEPILQTPYNSGQGLTASPYFGGLYDDIAVNYLGNKVGNIQHTMTWSTDMTKLTINIAGEAIAPAAVYSVVIMNNRFLTDANGNYLSGKPDSDGDIACLSPSAFVSAYASTWGMIATTFSTFGAIEAGAIADLKVKSPELLDYNDVPVLDWTNMVGAKSYNVYCQLIQWPVNTTCDVCDPDTCTTTGGQAHPYMLVQAGDLSGGPMYGMVLLWNNFFGTDNYLGPMGGDFVFVEDWGIKITYQCFVRGVNADGVEGPASNIVTIEDTVAPVASYSTYTTGYIPADTAPAPPIPVVTSITVCFSEPMNEKLVETIANWTLDSPLHGRHTMVLRRISLFRRLPILITSPFQCVQ